MREKLQIGISLAVGFVAAVLVTSHIKGETLGNTAFHLAAYCAAYFLLAKALKMFSKRKESAKGIEKRTLSVLTCLGHAIIVVILVLCVWAGVSYAGDGEIKGAAVLLLTGFLLAVSEGIKIRKIFFS